MRAQARFLQKIVANLDLPGCQHRHPGIVARLQPGIGIDVHVQQLKAEFGTQALQRLRHPGTQMAATADIDGQLIQIFTGRNRPERLIIIRNLDSKKGRAATTLQQQRHCLAGRQFLDQLLKLFNVLDRFVIDTQDNITLANAGL
jgi:hypothetical protein